MELFLNESIKHSQRRTLFNGGKFSRIATRSMPTETGGDTPPEDLELTQPPSSVRTLQTYVGPTEARGQEEKTFAPDTQQKKDTC